MRYAAGLPCCVMEKDAGLIETVVTKRVAAIEVELADLQTQAERLAAEIGELTAENGPE